MFQSQRAISPYDNYCDGYGNPGASGGSYFVGLNIGLGKAKEELSHKGSRLLDEINAFDRAEVDEAYLGQINMITVSSFCGPMGAIWGYHVVRPKNLYQKSLYFPKGKVQDGEKIIPVFDASPLFDATKKLFGSIGKKNFPLLPGAHVPCATKKIILHGPAHVYTCLGIGIAKKREDMANLFMEDVGSMHYTIDDPKAEADYKRMILHNKVKSIIEISHNQHIAFKEIFVGMKNVNIKKGEVGCALVAAPYFTIARDAFPSKGTLETMSLSQWEKDTGK